VQGMERPSFYEGRLILEIGLGPEGCGPGPASCASSLRSGLGEHCRPSLLGRMGRMRPYWFRLLKLSPPEGRNLKATVPLADSVAEGIRPARLRNGAITFCVKSSPWRKFPGAHACGAALRVGRRAQAD
jgi:hypothetical protein